MAAPPSTVPVIATIESDRVIEPDAQISSPKTRRPRRERDTRLAMVLLGCGIATVVAARWWVSRKSVDIHVVPDEMGYLSIGRLLAHAGVDWNMGVARSYSPGYGILLTPIFWLGGSGSAIYRHVIWLNVALGAVLLLLLYALVRRITDLSPPLAALAATVVSLAPAVVGHAGRAWSENLVSAAFVGLLLATLSVVRRPSPRAAAAVALLGPAAYAVHARLLPSVVVALGVIAVLGIQRRLAWRWAVGTVVSGAILVLGIRKGLALIDHTFYMHVTMQDSIRLSRFTHVSTILIEAAGQFWYLLVTTAGLVGFGAIAVIRAIARGPNRSATTPDSGSRLGRQEALVISGLCGMAIATSIVYATGGDRIDEFVYGRYNDAVIGPLVLLGIAAVTRCSLRRLAVETSVVVGATVATATVIWGFREQQLTHGAFGRETVFGLLPLIGASPNVHVVAVTLVGLALIGVVISIAAFRRRLLLLTALGALAIVGVIRVAAVVNPGPVVGARIGNVEQVSELLPAKSTVLYSFASGAPLTRFYQYQTHLPWLRFEADTSAHPTKPAAMFAMAGDTRMAQNGARLAYVDPYMGVGLWIPPGHLQDKLNRRGELLPAGFPAALPPEATWADVTFASKPRLVDHGRRLRASVRVDRDGRGSPWPVYQGRTHARGTVRLAISVTDPRCGCEVRVGRADFSRMVPPGHHRVNVTVDLKLARRLQPGRYQIQAQLVQEDVQFFGTSARASADVSH